jgi:hypothetical protein
MNLMDLILKTRNILFEIIDPITLAFAVHTTEKMLNVSIIGVRVKHFSCSGHGERTPSHYHIAALNVHLAS